jgi:GntR family transcriptional regulator, rspAB operon transcriptional repressor
MPSDNRQSETLGSIAYERIREKILLGEYPLGAPLSRRRLAEQLAMSLVPIAEALQKLEVEGFVESQPRVGTRVKIPTGSEVWGRYIVREALETESARLFAELSTEHDKSDLRQRARRVDMLSEVVRRRSDDRSASLEYERSHTAFHMKIAQCSGCGSLIEAIEQSRVLIFNWLFGVSTRMESIPERWHQDLVEVLCKGSVREADEAMRIHVRFRREEIVAKVNAFAPGKTRILRGPQRRNGGRVLAAKAEGSRAGLSPVR